MSDIQQVAFGAIERIAALRSSDDVLAELRKCGTVFEYENFCISGLPAPHEKADPYVLLSGWPEKWITHYLQSDFIHVDPGDPQGAALDHAVPVERGALFARR
jgi:LuxR family quorum sensing-dependent transcriptional regulator